MSIQQTDTDRTEADALEQQRALVDTDDRDSASGLFPEEADPADAAEQAREVVDELGEEDYPVG
ncbi:MAG TPA: hypothetical protein VGH99_11835 [Pseudonocardia sp.]